MCDIHLAVMKRASMYLPREEERLMFARVMDFSFSFRKQAKVYCSLALDLYLRKPNLHLDLNDISIDTQKLHCFYNAIMVFFKNQATRSIPVKLISKRFKGRIGLLSDKDLAFFPLGVWEAVVEYRAQKMTRAEKTRGHRVDPQIHV